MSTIAHVLDFEPDGTHTLDEFIVALGVALRARGWASVYVFSAEPKGDFAATLANAGVDWLVAPAQPAVREAVHLGRRLRPYAPEIVQTMFMSKFDASIFALKVASGAKFLITADHTSGGVRAASRLGIMAKRLRGLLAGLYTDRFIIVSDFVRRRDTEQLYLPDAKMRLVYNGVNVNRYTPADVPANEALNLAFVGQLIPQKGVLTLLRAVGKLAKDGVPVKLRIAGKGPHETALRDYCAENRVDDRVEFLGYVDSVIEVLQAADIVVVPSEWQEACAAVIFEAMACGVCVVVSDAGGNPEIVGQGGEAGLVFRAGDAADLAAKIRDLASDPPRRAAMRRAARERIVDNFTMQKMVDGYIRVYDELAV